MKFVAEIPARLGSKRVKMKNLRLLNGKPMIAYAIEACKAAKLVSDIYVNTESDKLGEVAEKLGAKFYKRKPELAEDHIVSDQFNYDFMKSIDMDCLVMVNPVSPLVTSGDIDSAIQYFEENEFDSMISVKEEKLQSFYQNKSLNFDVNGLLPMTQNIDPVQLCVWTVCIWRKEIFIKSYEENGFAVFSGKIGLYPINPMHAIKISYEEDFQMAEMLIAARNNKGSSKAEYYEI